MIRSVDLLSSESPSSYRFLEARLLSVSAKISALKKEKVVPSDLARDLELAFDDFNQSYRGIVALSGTSNPELFPKPDLSRSSSDFLQAVGRLDSWSEEFLKNDKMKVEMEENRMIEARKNSFSLIGIACAGYLLVMLAVGYVIQRSFLNPISRMANAADEALRERKSFTESSLPVALNEDEDMPVNSLVAAPVNVKSLFRKESGPKEIEILSKRLWQLVNKLEEAVDERTGQLAERTKKLESEIENRKKLEADLQHAQKMEAVGQMASGIAHEIRTPAQFAGDHLSFLKTFVE